MNKKIHNLNKSPSKGETFTIIAGPCSVESSDQFKNIIQFLNKNSISTIRGGLFKLRTQPDSFQGLREEGIDIVKKLKQELSFTFVSEITDPRQTDSLLEVTDILQVGTRNMFNYELLKELSKVSCPVLLKRGASATIKEWLHAVEYLTQGTNQDIILCERGIRTFEPSYRNTCDINAIAYLKQHTSYPVFLDPSHATGSSSMVSPIAKAGLAAGADGILIEVHHEPQQALSDGMQALNYSQMSDLLSELSPLAKVLNKTIV